LALRAWFSSVDDVDLRWCGGDGLTVGAHIGTFGDGLLADIALCVALCYV
jgi:hypothetical protein